MGFNSTFKYFIILIVSMNYILCISWIIECLIVIDARCKHEDNVILIAFSLPKGCKNASQCYIMPTVRVFVIKRVRSHVLLGLIFNNS